MPMEDRAEKQDPGLWLIENVGPHVTKLWAVAQICSNPGHIANFGQSRAKNGKHRPNSVEHGSNVCRSPRSTL